MRAGDWTDEYKRRVREYVAENGRPVDQNRSIYGWCDWTAQQHTYTDACTWVILPGAQMEEQTYYQFEGTFVDGSYAIGINVTPAHCTCGKYTDVTLRYEGSLQDILAGILKIPTNPYIEL